MEGRGRRMHGWRDTEREGWKQMDGWMERERCEQKRTEGWMGEWLGGWLVGRMMEGRKMLYP